MEQYYIVRAEKAGVFFGKIKERKGDEVTMTDVRKIWEWRGACAVEQIAVDGVSEESKLTVTVREMVIIGACQIIPCTEKATENLLAIKDWRHTYD